MDRTAGDLRWVPPGAFSMGSDDHYAEEAPTHRVHLDGFWIERTPVTNRQFAAFVDATGYRTVAERTGASAVFSPPTGPVPLDDPRRWWKLVNGADWRHPEGPASDLQGRDDHPVQHVAYVDAVSYADHVGRALPTEAQWEYAARGGLDGTAYAWGDELSPDGRSMANTWLGEFPWRNDKPTDPGPVPVGSFPPNGFDLVDMIGQVWEWTSDWYQPTHGNSLGLSEPSEAPACCGPRNPTGPSRGMRDRADPSSRLRVMKGGSFLCAANYCSRYRPAARIGQALTSSASNTGFRCIAA